MYAEEYKKKYPGAKIMSDAYQQKHLQFRHSEETKEKMRENMKNRDREVYDKIKNKIKKTIQKQYDDEGRKTWNKGVMGYTTSRRGQKHSEKTKEKMKKNHWSKTQPDKFKKFMAENRPTNPTVYEDRFCGALNDKGIVFTRQKKVGTLACDIFLPFLNLIVEIDGYTKPPERDEFIKSQGFSVIHFANKEIENNLEECVKKCVA